MSGKLCARPAPKFGYLPCSREPHADGPCAHEALDANHNWTPGQILVSIHNSAEYVGDRGVNPVHTYRLTPPAPAPVVDDVLLCGAGHWRVTERRFLFDKAYQREVVEIMLLCEYEGPNKW